MDSPNLLLINPWIHDFAAFNLWVRPLGFLYLYSFLRKKGHKLSYIDLLQVTDTITVKENSTLKRLKSRMLTPAYSGITEDMVNRLKYSGTCSSLLKTRI